MEVPCTVYILQLLTNLSWLDGDFQRFALIVTLRWWMEEPSLASFQLSLPRWPINHINLQITQINKSILQTAQNYVYQLINLQIHLQIRGERELRREKFRSSIKIGRSWAVPWLRRLVAGHDTAHNDRLFSAITAT